MIAVCALLLLASLSEAANPTFPHRYHVKGNIYLPYGEINEPYEAWVDLDKGMSRIDYYGGESKVINRKMDGNYGMMYKIIPVPMDTTGPHCYHIAGQEMGQVEAQPVFPNISGFLDAGKRLIPTTNITAELYFDTLTVEKKNNSYYCFVNQATKLPILFYFIGYDNLFGSHYDQYEIVYIPIDDDFDDSVFDLYQKFNCTNFPGPGLADPMHGNPMFEFLGSANHKDERKTAQFESDFDLFKSSHGKEYSTDKEHFERKKIFKENYNFINSHNRAGKSYSVAVNHLADRTDKERMGLRGYYYSPERDSMPKTGVFGSGEAIPPSMDWRIQGAVTRVKDQGICGSCWSFGTTGTLEGAYFLKHGMRIEFSEQALIDCSWPEGNNGCDGGEDFRAYKWILANQCLPTELTYGIYKMQDSTCHNKAARCGVSIKNYTLVTPYSEPALLSAIANVGPISVAIDASHKSFAFYSDGVYYEPDCGSKPDQLDHAVLAVGYGTLQNMDYWLVKNSWSTYWGNVGYILMSRKNNNCGVATAPSYATVA